MYYLVSIINPPIWTSYLQAPLRSMRRGGCYDDASRPGMNPRPNELVLKLRLVRERRCWAPTVSCFSGLTSITRVCRYEEIVFCPLIVLACPSIETDDDTDASLMQRPH